MCHQRRIVAEVAHFIGNRNGTVAVIKLSAFVDIRHQFFHAADGLGWSRSRFYRQLEFADKLLLTLGQTGTQALQAELYGRFDFAFAVF